ncbi:hypothetical protein CVT26_001276 [Gymnopilus dilepis]|uniref:MARVEL domain-containing protein n=1 Tax=Gymnopilus dilepis TaxID=231916 RepID=A0A409Y258_9AGAR|nr:hypothetical protein CVT26_001276 [Gymnopilus dilepis]
MLHIVRLCLYALLFACSTVLLALTAFRIHHTKSSDTPDVYTGHVHFYDPIVAALLVTSILSVLFSMYFLSIIAGRLGRAANYASEHVCLAILWIMFLVCAAVFTHDFVSLKRCRGFDKQCRTLETIKGFAWINFGLVTFLWAASFGNMGQRGASFTGPAHGREEMRQTTGHNVPASAAPAADTTTGPTATTATA